MGAQRWVVRHRLSGARFLSSAEAKLLRFTGELERFARQAGDMSRRGEAARVAAMIARTQDGLVQRRQLTELGVPRHLVGSLVKDGYLHRVLRSIYVIGVPEISHRQLLRSGLLLGGVGTQLSHRTSNEQFGLLPVRRGKVTVTSPRANSTQLVRTLVPMSADGGGRGLIHVRESTKMSAPVLLDGLSSAPVPRSLVDLAASSDKATVERAWREAEFRGLLSRERLLNELKRGRTGTAVVRELLNTREILTNEDSGLRSPPELDMLHLISEAGLPAPETDVLVSVGGVIWFADFLWRELNLVLELDSPDHLKPTAGARDRDRDVAFFVAELDVIRFLDTAVALDPVKYMDRLRAVMERQRRRMP